MSTLVSNTLDQSVKPEPLLTTKDAARFLSVSVAFLERDRWAGARIPFVRVGARAVRYKLSELEAYINGQMRTSTADCGAGQ
jgi:hypothetical protein